MVKNYDPKRFIITFGGIPATGFADGTFIAVTSPSQTFTKTVGADGEVARAKGNDNTNEITITLLQTSLFNDYLSNIYKIDKATNQGKLILALADLEGTTVMIWSQAWIRQLPDIDRGKEIGENAWIFDTGQINAVNVGGNF